MSKTLFNTNTFQSKTLQNSNKIEVAIFEGKLEIDRTLFGMEHTPSVGDLVKLNFYCELVEEK